VKAYVSVWSMDPLAVGDGVASVEEVADGFHVDVFDGHAVPELLFGPDLVAALRGGTAALLDVHLVVTNPEAWVERFVAAGADVVTVHPRACADLHAALELVAAAGARPGVALETDEPVERAAELIEQVDRVLVMGTALGIKGVGQDPRTAERVAALRAVRDASERRPELVVDGGIRRETVPRLAEAGADGVVPGSLVLGDPDPAAAVRWIQAQATRAAES